MDIAAPTVTPRACDAAPARPGKSAQSVGHQAKAAVAAAREAGADLPKNAQGLAASQIARGADPASLFAALLPPAEAPDATPAEGEAGTPADDAGNAGTGDPEGVATAAEAGYGAAASVVGDRALTAAETALSLIDDTAV